MISVEAIDAKHVRTRAFGEPDGSGMSCFYLIEEHFPLLFPLPA